MTLHRENYEDIIKNHTNYDFIPEELRNQWVSVSKKGNPNPRQRHWNDKLNQLITPFNISNADFYLHKIE